MPSFSPTAARFLLTLLAAVLLAPALRAEEPVAPATRTGWLANPRALARHSSPQERRRKVFDDRLNPENAVTAAVASPTGATPAVGPQPQATGQILEVSSVNPNDSQYYYGSATYTVPTTTATQYDEVDVGIHDLTASTTATGTVNQTGGQLVLAAGSSGGQGGLYLGYYGGDTGFYNLSGNGSLQAVTEIVGYGGTGTFAQTGGNNAVGTGGLFVGNQNTYSGTNNGTGTYTFSSGTLTAPNESIGYHGSGTFTQSGGTNTVAAGGTLSLGYQTTGTYNLSGGTLNTPSVSMVTTANGNTTAGRGVFNFNGGVLQASAATTTFVSGLTAANVQAGGAKIDTQTYSVTIPQVLLHSGTSTDGGLTKQTGTGTLILSGANTYTGPTTVNTGTLQAGVASVAGTSGAFGVNSAVTLGTANGVTLALNGFSTQIGSLTGYGSVTLGGATLTVGGDNSSPAYAYAGVISGGGGLTKIGAGALSLSGANTYSGLTTVNAGTLLVNGTNSGQNGVAVNSGGVLGGTGTISGQVNVNNGGTLSPGSNVGSVGKLTVGTLTLTSASPVFDIITGTFYDQVVATGAYIALGSGSYLTLNVTPSSQNYTVGQVLDLVHGTGVFSGTFSNFANGGTYTYGVDTFQANYTNLGFNLTVTSVPEPATWAGGALLFATAALTLRCRLRRA